MKLLPYFRRIEGREGEERRASFLVLVCGISIGHIFLNAGFWDKICSFSGVSASWPLALFIYSIVYLGVTVYLKFWVVETFALSKQGPLWAQTDACFSSNAESENFLLWKGAPCHLAQCL